MTIRDSASWKTKWWWLVRVQCNEKMKWWCEKKMKTVIISLAILSPFHTKMCAAAIVMVRDNVHHQMQPYMQVLNAKAVRQIISSIRTGPIIVTNMAILYPWIYDKRKKRNEKCIRFRLYLIDSHHHHHQINVELHFYAILIFSIFSHCQKHAGRENGLSYGF